MSKKCKSHKNTQGKKQQKAKKKLVAQSQFILILTCDHSGPDSLQSPNDTQRAPRIRIRHCTHGTKCLFGLQTRGTKCHTIVFFTARVSQRGDKFGRVRSSVCFYTAAFEPADLRIRFLACVRITTTGNESAPKIIITDTIKSAYFGNFKLQQFPSAVWKKLLPYILFEKYINILPRALANEVIKSVESVHPFVSILQFLNQLTCEFDFLRAYASRP